MTNYTFQLGGYLDPRWASSFDGFTISHTYTVAQQPITILSGPVVDAAALYGFISRLRDLGATLISLHPTESEATI